MINGGGTPSRVPLVPLHPKKVGRLFNPKLTKVCVSGTYGYERFLLDRCTPPAPVTRSYVVTKEEPFGQL